MERSKDKAEENADNTVFSKINHGRKGHKAAACDFGGMAQ
ncbi:uncharacterized protein G2W53_004843 [Senna tora]|uniref:Uncharacterized protein n=1 Tax=Senna tora TaxID=362788 RepID=A0A834XCB4_9FABA|nr:uncharacterized protein G2W53_004843 [Senna tora]